MTRLNPWSFGAVLSVTVVVGYILCALFWYALTGTAIEFLNALFHGVDFRKIYAPSPFAAVPFLCVLGVLAIWAYTLGAVYAAVHNLILLRDGKD